MLRVVYDHLKRAIIFLLYIFQNMNTVLQCFATVYNSTDVFCRSRVLFRFHSAFGFGKQTMHTTEISQAMLLRISHILLGFDTSRQEVTLDRPENGVQAV